MTIRLTFIAMCTLRFLGNHYTNRHPALPQTEARRYVKVDAITTSGNGRRSIYAL